MLISGKLSRFFIFFLAVNFLSGASVGHAEHPLVPAATAVLNTMPVSHAAVMDLNEWQELDCDVLVQKLDRSATSFGPWGLQQLLWPLSDGAQLEERQKLIQALVCDERFFSRVQAALQRVARTQDRVLAYWNEHDDLGRQAQSLYYSILGSHTASLDAKLNNNRFALEFAAAIDAFKRFKSLVITFGLNGFLQEVGDSGKNFSVTGALKKSFTWLGRAHSLERHNDSAASDKSFWIDGLSWSAGDKYCALSKNSANPLGKIAAAGGVVLLTGYLDGSLFLEARDSIVSLREFFALTNALQKHMVAVACFFKAVRELRSLFEQHGYGACVKPTSATVSTGSPDKIKRLEQLLKTGTFSHEYTTVYSRGRVLLAHKLMKESAQELVPTLQVLAELDAYCSIACLYKESATKRTRFCFAQFAHDPRAQLDMADCWIPVLPGEQSAGNSISWGTAQAPANKIIITGPNGCGKSTVMKMASWGVLLAQSWGIVPASAAHMSLFGCIKTSLNPQENLQKGMSTFMAEKYRMDAIAGFVRSWAGKGPLLLLLDEPYHGTIGSEAADRVMSFGKQLAEKPWCMLLMATHLEAVTQLPEQTNGAFANYCLDAAQDADGLFTRTFTLQPGMAHWWFADQVKRRQFIDQLLDRPATQ